MNQCELAIYLAQNNNGIITSKLANENGIKRQILVYLVKIGKLVKSDVGIYTLPAVFDDEYYNIQFRYKRGIFSSLSSLYLLHLTDVIPSKIYLTFPSGYNYSKVLDKGVHCFKSNEYNIGIIEVPTVMNNIVKCYNPERTLCDIIRKKKYFDIRIITDAFKNYVKSNKKNIPLLMKYASVFHVEKQINNYLEVLL